MIVIIDYGIGNTGSIQNMLKKIGFDSCVSRNTQDILNASKIILPGVGAFDSGIINLKKFDLLKPLNESKKNGTDILGICLGMQLMAHESEEGNLSGLAWIEAKVKKFSFQDNKFKIPHMGWNIVNPYNQSSIFNNFNEEIRAYFVHSYYVVCNNEQDVISKTNYGIDFVSAFQHDNIYGMQFHPEKSHKFGIQLLKNFVEI